MFLLFLFLFICIYMSYVHHLVFLKFLFVIFILPQFFSVTVNTLVLRHLHFSPRLVFFPFPLSSSSSLSWYSSWYLTSFSLKFFAFPFLLFRYTFSYFILFICISTKYWSLPIFASLLTFISITFSVCFCSLRSSQ